MRGGCRRIRYRLVGCRGKAVDYRAGGRFVSRPLNDRRRLGYAAHRGAGEDRGRRLVRGRHGGEADDRARGRAVTVQVRRVHPHVVGGVGGKPCKLHGMRGRKGCFRRSRARGIGYAVDRATLGGFVGQPLYGGGGVGFRSYRRPGEDDRCRLVGEGEDDVLPHVCRYA